MGHGNAFFRFLLLGGGRHPAGFLSRSGTLHAISCLDVNVIVLKHTCILCDLGRFALGVETALEFAQPLLLQVLRIQALMLPADVNAFLDLGQLLISGRLLRRSLRHCPAWMTQHRVLDHGRHLERPLL